ncbi:lasso peptide biosynthesis B2 protein [Ancylobacter aquaticus]|uniref:lasso peptide biosynthesis B2 protein n=1 Tax=Ancylobacter aquaticus TaxID=100 RepID=UPI001FE0FE66|nr:lasso peptide biosynthesis B2 protein [Ancylobacter aquaticus]
MNPRPPPSLAARWRRLSWRDRALLGEALLTVGLARLAIVLVPFRHVARIAATRPRRPPAADAREQIIRVRWAIRAVARRMPFRALCLEQGLSARMMLNRRSLPTTLFYGVMKGAEGQLMAHLWVRSDEIEVIGTEGLERFTLLATFPPLDKPGTARGADRAR